MIDGAKVINHSVPLAQVEQNADWPVVQGELWSLFVMQGFIVGQVDDWQTHSNGNGTVYGRYTIRSTERIRSKIVDRVYGGMRWKHGCLRSNPSLKRPFTVTLYWFTEVVNLPPELPWSIWIRSALETLSLYQQKSEHITWKECDDRGSRRLWTQAAFF